MNTPLNKKILENIQEQNLEPKSLHYFFAKEILLWIGTFLALVLGGISAGSFIFQIYNASFVPPHLIIIFTLTRIIIIIISLSIALYQIIHTKKGYKRTRKKYIIFILFIVTCIGSLLFFTNISGVVENRIGNAGLIRQSRDYWSQPEQGLLSGQLDYINADGYYLVRNFKDELHRVDVRNIDVQQQNIFTDFPRVRIVGYEQDSIFYPCAVAPWEIRGATREKNPRSRNINKGTREPLNQKRNHINFTKTFERKNEIVRTNRC